MLEPNTVLGPPRAQFHLRPGTSKSLTAQSWRNKDVIKQGRCHCRAKKVTIPPITH
ncbi:hypothetical protein RSAG8_08968, partial [Rhizoctonia solani AG-8 WAC10335]